MNSCSLIRWWRMWQPCRQGAVCDTGRFTSYHSTFHYIPLSHRNPARGTSNMVPLRSLAGYMDAWLSLSVTSINVRVGVPVFFLSLLLALSLFPVNLLGCLPWLLIGSWSCHSSLSDLTPTYPLPVKFPLADKRTLKGVNGDLSFALCICGHFTNFWLALFVISLCQNPLCFVLTFLILITFWFAILFG